MSCVSAAALGRCASAPANASLVVRRRAPVATATAVGSRKERSRSRRYARTATVVSPEVEYSPAEAVELMKSTATAGFDERAEVHCRLGIDPRYNDQQLRCTVSLPEGSGRVVKVCVVADGKDADLAIEAGAERAGGDDVIAELAAGEHLKYDKIVATPAMMPKLAKLGRVLGPRGLMPNPKAGTVTSNVSQAVADFRGGRVELRADKGGIAHVAFGMCSFTAEALVANLEAVAESVDSNRPIGAKGVYWKSAYVCSAMGPSVKLDVSTLSSSKLN